MGVNLWKIHYIRSKLSNGFYEVAKSTFNLISWLVAWSQILVA